MMEEMGIKLRILARAEISLLKADAHRRTNRVLLTGLAIGCLLVALVFLNVGAFFLLTQSAAEAKAAFVLAAINGAVALVPFLMARSIKPGAEEQMVRDIREMAAAEITRDFAKVSGDVREVTDGLKDLKQGVTDLAGGGTGALMALGPLLPVVIDLLKKARHR